MEKPIASSSLRPLKTAFYPCCHDDIEEPLRLLSGYVGRVIFCDINPKLYPRWKRIYRSLASDQLPSAEFMIQDAREALSVLPVIDALFYRRDSTGGGGSALFVLGDVFLRPLMMRFSSNGGLIFTDGVNSRGGNFKKMIRRSGLIKHGWKFSTAPEQPYLGQHHLWKISVCRLPTQPTIALPQ